MGFTLLELIVVIAVMVILLALTVPAITGMSGAMQLTTNGDAVRNYLVEAQLRAISGNRPVEVWFYSHEDPSLADSTAAFRTLSMVATDGQNGQQAISPPLRLTGNAIISGIPGASSLTDTSLVAVSPGDETTAPADLFNGAPTYHYTILCFYPDGSTGLPARAGTDTWHLTLVDDLDGSLAGTSLPENFYTLQVDPFTGRVTVFRP